MKVTAGFAPDRLRAFTRIRSMIRDREAGEHYADQ
jgi:hypothetical protein